MWPIALRGAKADAEDEMGRKSTVAKATWKEVLEMEYEVDNLLGHSHEPNFMEEIMLRFVHFCLA